MEYYSSTKRNKIMSFEATWMELEAIIQSEVTQEQKTKYHMLLTYKWELNDENSWAQKGEQRTLGPT